MTTYHVDSRQGLDGNTGLSFAAAKQTIAGALAVATTGGDVIILHSGYYNEFVNILNTNVLTIEPDGYVEIYRAVPGFSVVAFRAASANVTLGTLDKTKGTIVVRHTDTTSNFNPSVSLCGTDNKMLGLECYSTNAAGTANFGVVVGQGFGGGAESVTRPTVQECLIVSYGTFTGANQSTLTLNHQSGTWSGVGTIVGNTIVSSALTMLLQNSVNLDMRENIGISSSNFVININGPYTYAGDRNNWYSATTTITSLGNLAAWRAANPGDELLSIETNPQINNVAAKCYTLAALSPALTLAADGEEVGAFKEGRAFVASLDWSLIPWLTEPLKVQRNGVTFLIEWIGGAGPDSGYARISLVGLTGGKIARRIRWTANENVATPGSNAKILDRTAYAGGVPNPMDVGYAQNASGLGYVGPYANVERGRAFTGTAGANIHFEFVLTPTGSVRG